MAWWAGVLWLSEDQAAAMLTLQGTPVTGAAPAWGFDVVPPQPERLTLPQPERGARPASRAGHRVPIVARMSHQALVAGGHEVVGADLPAETGLAWPGHGDQLPLTTTSGARRITASICRTLLPDNPPAVLALYKASR